jgi:hypothetical protein
MEPPVYSGIPEHLLKDLSLSDRPPAATRPKYIAIGIDFGTT